MHREDLHKRGTCLVHLDRNATFVVIPKNASTSIRHKPNQVYFSDTFVPNDIVYAILREPTERFVSGFLEIFKADRKNDWLPEWRHLPNLDWEQRLDLTTTAVAKGQFFDPHLSPQSTFLADLNGNPYPVNLYFSHANLNEEYYNQFGVNLQFTQRNIPELKQRIDNLLTDKHKADIAKAYARDYQLYSQFR